MTTLVESQPCTLSRYRSPGDLGPAIPEKKLEVLFALLRQGHAMTASCRIAHTSSFSVNLKARMDEDFAQTLAEAEADGQRVRRERKLAESLRKYCKEQAALPYLDRWVTIGINDGTSMIRRRDVKPGDEVILYDDVTGQYIGTEIAT